MNRSSRQHVLIDWTPSRLNSWIKKCTCGLFIHTVFERKHKYCTNKLTNKHHQWYHSLHTHGESVSVCFSVAWRCERSRHLLSFLLCIVSVVLFLSVLSLSCLCFYSCCHLSFCPVYTLSDLANKPPHTCYSVSQMRSLSQIMALLMPQLQVHHWEQRNCCKNSCFFFGGVSVGTCKGAECEVCWIKPAPRWPEQ